MASEERVGEDAFGHPDPGRGGRPDPEVPSGAGAIFGPFLNAIFAPAEAWKALDAKPKLVVWVILLIVVVSTIVAIFNAPIMEQITMQSMRAQMRASGQDISEEQLQSMATFGRYAAYGSGIMTIVQISIIALLLWVLASVMGGKGASFLRAFGVTSVGAVIHPLLYGIYASVIWNMNPPEIRRPQDASTIAPTLGLDLLFAGPDTPAWLEVLMQRLDLFNVWWAFLIVGGSMAVLKLRKGQAITAAVVVWSLFTLIAMAGALAQGLAGS